MQPWEQRGLLGGVLAMRINGLSEIAQNYDAMLIDQFGVIHDGKVLYPGALEVLTKLHALQIPVVVITNSGKRSGLNQERLVKMGVLRELFLSTVSSGEVAFQSLGQKRAYLIGKCNEDYGFDGVEFVTADQAAVMLILGSNAPETSLNQYRDLLKFVKLPCICCNPDKLMLSPQGLQSGPGAIATLYEEMGGHVSWIGKPYPSIYLHALGVLGNPDRVLCVGDSAEHDVAGGQGVGLDTLLVQQGVSAHLTEADIEPKPNFIMTKFTWLG
jgi:HAD superfamily hydrolase (TIGR01459 family)